MMVMATSKSSNSSGAGDKKTPPRHSAGLVQESAQQIWLAGLGAFAKAQEEGSKAFQSLVKEGMSLQSQTKAAAEEKLAEATRKLSSLADTTQGMAAGLTGLGAKVAQPWDKLETIFEDRVAKALAHLGMPSSQAIQALQAEVDALKQRVKQLEAGKATAKTAPKVTPKASAKTVSKAPPKVAPKAAKKAVAKTRKA
jgi:poly(hydroxyalkanoate) granule-associated protein